MGEQQEAHSRKPIRNTLRHSRPSIIRLPDVKLRTGLGRSTIYAMIAAGEFPAQVVLSKRSIGFVEAEIDAWLSQRIQARGV